MRRSPLIFIALALAGCGSADSLPPPAAPSSTTPTGARLDTRARTLTVDGRTVDAGVGPAQVAETDERVYVTDAAQRALLVFEKEPELRLQRRSHLPGPPAAIAVEGDRVLVTLAGTGERVALTLGGFEP